MAAIGGPPWHAYSRPRERTAEERLAEAVTDGQTRATGVHPRYHRIALDEARAIADDRDALIALFDERYPQYPGYGRAFAGRVLNR